MERLAKYVMEVLGKLGSLVSLATFNLVKEQPPVASGKSHEHPYRPTPSIHSVLTSSPLVPAILLLSVMLLLLSSTQVQTWFVEGGNLPTLGQIFGLFKDRKGLARMPAASENVGVWAKRQSGFYYCQGGVLFGREPGKIMTQGEALLSGYRPADSQYCTDGPRQVSAGSVPFRVRQWVRSAAGNLPSGDDLLARFRKTHSALPKGSEGVSVWAKRQSGFYYCQSDILFGRKPGKLMKQSAALLSGYRPAGRQYCTNNKPAEASAGSLPLPDSASVR